MEAVVFDPERGELKFVKRAPPRGPVGDEVLVRVAFAGICGTDLHIAEGEFPCSDSEFVLGHEFSGVAVAVGPEVRHLKSGDKVTVDPNRGCSTCASCTSGKYHLCNEKAINDTIGIFKDGGWAEYCLVPGSQAFKIPEGITLEQAALTEPISCLAHGWNRISPVTLGQNILIQGAGIIGNLWAAALHLQGHKRVTISEPNESRRRLVEKLETSYNCVSPTELNAMKADLIIDCSGSAKAIESALDMLSPGGKLCIFGVAPPDAKMRDNGNGLEPVRRTVFTFNHFEQPGLIGESPTGLGNNAVLNFFVVSPYEIYKREITIIGVMINPFTFPAAFGLIEAMGPRYLDYERLGVKVFALEDFGTALENLKSGAISKAVFKMAP